MFDIEQGKKVKEQEEAGVLIPITDVHGVEQEGSSLTVVGSYSATYQKNADEYRKWNVEAKREPSADELRAAVYACGVKSWEGLTSGGNDFPCTIQNSVALLDACPWILDKVRERVFDHAGFFSQPSANS